MIAERERDSSKPTVDVSHDGTEIPTLDVGADIDATRVILAINDALSRCYADVGHFTQSYVSASGRVDHEIANATDTVTAFGSTPDIHIVGLSMPEEIAHFLPRKHGPGGPAHIAGLDTVLASCREVDFDLELRHFRLELDVQIHDAGNPFQGLLDFVGLAVDDFQFLSIDAHGEGFARSRQNLVDPLV